MQLAQSNRLDSKKIEKAAVLAIKNLIQPCETIDDKLDDDDKNILVDGSLEVYKSSALTIKNFIGKVDVQIKGTTRMPLVNRRGFMKYQIEVENLKRYLEVFHGVLFFCVYVDAAQGSAVGKQVFYAQLLPYDITQILSHTREGQKKVSVQFRLFPTEPKEVLRRVMAFRAEREKQLKATVADYGFLDKNFKLPPNKRSISFSTQLFPGEPVTTLNGLQEGPYFYGEDGDGHLTVFGKMGDVSAFAMGIEAVVGSGDFSEKMMVFSGQSKDGDFLEFEGVRMHLDKGSIDYTVSGGIHKRYKTVHFMCEFAKTGKLTLDGETVVIANLDEVDEAQRIRLEESLEAYGHIAETMDTLRIRADWDTSLLSERELNDINFMRRLLVDKKPLKGQKLESPLIHFDIQDTYVFAWAHKLKDGSYKFKSLFSEDLFLVAGSPDPASGELAFMSDPVPPVVALNEEGYRKIVNLVPDSVEKAFEKHPIVPSCQDLLNQKLIEMLSAFDKGCQQPDAVLATAAILARKLLEADSTSETHFLNLMQTYKRKRDLSAEERKRLQDVAIDSGQPYAKAAAFALLDNMEMARNCLNRCTEAERRQIEDYPISRFFHRS